MSTGWLAHLLERPLVTRRLLPLLVAFALAYVLYKRVPPVHVEKRWAAAGALIFAVGHDLAVSLHAAYITRIARQDAFYGSFVGVISLAVWTWVVSCLVLFGAELVAELNGDRERDSSAAAERRRTTAVHAKK